MDVRTLSLQQGKRAACQHGFIIRVGKKDKKVHILTTTAAGIISHTG